jgi:hypothetical protein
VVHAELEATPKNNGDGMGESEKIKNQRILTRPSRTGPVLSRVSSAKSGLRRARQQTPGFDQFCLLSDKKNVLSNV